MNNLDNNKGPGVGFAIVAIPAMLICCALPLLFAGGILSGLMAWITDGPVVAMAFVGVVCTAAVFIYRTRSTQTKKNQVITKTSGEATSKIELSE